MSDKFKNKYRISSARLQNWDYSSNAPYFITICTKNREPYFGEIVSSLMQLSEIGKIVETEWLKTPEIRQDMNLKLGRYVVMPNHFHGIIVIGENEYNDHEMTECRDAMHGVSTDKSTDEHYRDAMHRVSTSPLNHFGPQSKNLASIIRGFKSAVTINARKIHADFEWQSRFHDHIIRNAESFQKISDYIVNNPIVWAGDKFYNR